MSTFKVLFVDDDPFMLKALSRTARRLRPEWYFIGCESALLWQQSWGDTTEPDLIVTDLQMPDLSGNELLVEAADLVPATMRVLLTGDTSETVITHASQFAHAIIAKPFSEHDFEQLFDRVERLSALPLSVSCRKKLGAFSHLPQQPEFVQQLRRVMASPSCDVAQIADILQQEPVLTAKLVQIANSAFMGFSSTVNTLHDAIARLGTSMTEAIVTLYLLIDDTGSERDLSNQRQIIADSLNHAAIARELAKLSGVKRQQQDMIYAAAVFSAIGLLFLARHQNEQTENPLLFGSLEPGFSNSSLLTVYLLTLWGYDRDVCDIILWQGWPSSNCGVNEPYAFILFLSKHYLQADDCKQREALLDLIEDADIQLAFQQLLNKHDSAF